jgi:glucosamine--fructose-6-phosphate aminotransferase (isomerizing)
MCGIFGCVLKDGNAAPLIHAALRRLEYRGYDSAGVASIFENHIVIKKDEGKIEEVHKRLNLDDLPGHVGLGHTRWATHGAPDQINAHPHTDCNERIAVVHNGIIENFMELKRSLGEQGHRFKSRTDTEVIPHLIEENLKNGLSFIKALREAILRLEGSYAISVISTLEPEKIFCARNESPLVIGVGEDSVYCASDIPAFLPLTNNALIVEDGELIILDRKGYEIRNIKSWEPISREPKIVDWTPRMAEKQGYPHFMLKEIHEQARCLKDTLRLQDTYLDLMATFLDRADEIFLVACGTSYYACLAASYMFSKLAFLSTHPVVASEFIEQEGMAVNINSTILAVSQSGETADTLEAINYARNRAGTILGLTNVVGSTLTRLSRVYVVQQSGPEIGVAATKTFTSQLSVLTQLASRVSKIRGKMSHRQIDEFEENINNIPELVEKTTDQVEKKVQEIVKKYKDKEAFFFLGRGMSRATALEGCLKLMEISYIPSLSYPAGESRQKAPGIIKPGFPVIAICPKDETYNEIKKNLREMKALGASIITIIEKDDKEIQSLSDDFLEVERNGLDILSPIVFVIPLQLFAYYMAVERGLNPDKPRNLAKSVTVK